MGGNDQGNQPQARRVRARLSRLEGLRYASGGPGLNAARLARLLTPRRIRVRVLSAADDFDGAVAAESPAFHFGVHAVVGPSSTFTNSWLSSRKTRGARRS